MTYAQLKFQGYQIGEVYYIKEPAMFSVPISK